MRRAGRQKLLPDEGWESSWLWIEFTDFRVDLKGHRVAQSFKFVYGSDDIVPA